MSSKVGELVAKTMNNNTLINLCLGVSFVTLCVRSVNQQKDIEALEEEKDSLVKANKAIKKAMWNWKQKLFEEASAAGSSATVPLSKLKAIYGEVQTPPPGEATARNADQSTAAKFVV